MKDIRGRLILVTLLLIPVSAFSDPPTHEGKVVLFGNLHAHSKLSRDVKNATDELLPAKAFAYADQHGLDFLAITDHHKAKADGEKLRIATVEYRDLLFGAAKTYNAAHQGKFVAIAGIEWGNISTGNHINVFGSPTLPPDTIGPKDYDELIEWAGSNAKFIQFNHPNSWSAESKRDKSVGNYGMARYASTQKFVEAASPTLRTVSIISTVQGGHIKGEFKDSDKKTHREMQWEKYYQQFLDMGLHLGPAANQDTHGPNWGTVTAARTAVWADSFDYDGVMKAFRDGRVYATEDDELVVAFQVDYDGKRYWMGDSVPLKKEEDEVKLLIKVWQAAGSDGDPVSEGPYEIVIKSDSDGVGGELAAEWGESFEVESGKFVSIPVPVVDGEYIYLQVTEKGGADNPEGEGEDEQINATGEDGSDDLRDDMNDSAWTSPIWFTLTALQQPTAVTPGQSVWSKNSELYHDPHCRFVGFIGAANRRQGTPPSGKTKHACATQ